MVLIINDNKIVEGDPTYPATIASWMLWVVDTLGDTVLRKDCLRSLLSAAGPEGGNSV